MERVVEMNDRTQRTKSVANEIVQICRDTALSRIILRFVNHLISASLDGRGKFIVKRVKAIKDLNQIKPRLMKSLKYRYLP